MQAGYREIQAEYPKKHSRGGLVWGGVPQGYIIIIIIPGP